jgi:hypothetical protein
MPLNEEGNNRIVPELMFYFPLTQLAENTEWEVASLRVGFALKLSPSTQEHQQQLQGK